MTNVKAFNAELRKLTKRLPREAIIVMQRKFAFDALRGVVLKTPVKTGRARGNWQVTVNRSPENALERKDKPGQATIDKGTARLTNVPAFAIIYITNNVPYIVYLENGSSEQASQGMVAVTFEELRLSLR